MPSEWAKQKVDEIAEYLLTNGAGERAARLMLLGAHGQDLGGWGLGPLVDMFATVLDSARAEGLAEGEERERWACYESVTLAFAQFRGGCRAEVERRVAEAIAARGPDARAGGGR